MPFTLPPITLTQNQTSLVTLPGNLGSVSYLKLVNASPYLLAINNLLGGSDYMQPGEANVWPVPGLTTAVQVTPQQFGINPAIIPSTALVVTWYLEGEKPNGNYPVNFNTISFLGGNVTASVNTPNSLEQDLLTPFVLTGLVATKDGSVANKLDVTGGVALLRQTDQSLGRVALNATSYTTVQISSTYYLDLNPDGSFSFATSHSGVTNYLPIAQATTDGSGNIATVTDERTLTTSFLSAGLTPTAFGEVNLAPVTSETVGAANQGRLENFSASNAVILKTAQAGAAQGIVFGTWTGSALGLPLALGANPFASGTALDQNGVVTRLAGQAAAGGFGVPVIVASFVQQNVTTTGATPFGLTIPASGIYRVSVAFRTGIASAHVTLQLQWTDETPAVRSAYFTIAGATSGVANALVLGSASAYAGLPMTVYAASGFNMNMYYTNATATPNDFVNILYERLA